MIRIERYDGDRTKLLSFFRQADDSDLQIDRYLLNGVVLVAVDVEEIVGHVQVVETSSAGIFEIVSVAVQVGRQSRGIGRSLVEAAVAFCREERALSVVVSTATADIENLRFYQRRGFRMDHIVRNAFGPDTGYADGVMVDGILLSDKVVFTMDLQR